MDGWMEVFVELLMLFQDFHYTRSFIHLDVANPNAQQNERHRARAWNTYSFRMALACMIEVCVCTNEKQ